MKKGTLSAGVDIILFLIAAIVLFFLFSPVFDYFLGKSDEEICRVSVLAAGKARIMGQSFSSIECPAKEVEIERPDVYESGGVNEEKIKEIFAEEMRICWWKMGEGKLEMFSEEEALGRRNVCVICSRVSVDESVQSEVMDVEGFFDFLEETNLPGNSSMSYADYMTIEDANALDVRMFWGLAGTASEYVFLNSVSEGLDEFFDEKDETLDSPSLLDLTKEHLVVFRLWTKPNVESLPLLEKVSGHTFERNSLPGIFLVEEEDINKLECDNVYQ